MSGQLRVADFMSCSGGAARGFQRAGCHVTSFDIAPQRNNCADVFEQRDIFTITPVEARDRFDFIHASPICQGLTEMNNDKSRHTNQIPSVRELLDATCLPYQIENVRAARAHLRNPVALFGTMFDLHLVTSAGQRFVLSRERLFETNWGAKAPVDPGPQGYPIANIIGGHLRCRSGDYRTGKGTGRTVDFEGEDRPALTRAMMEMPWATMAEMSEAIPPAYTEYLARQFMARQAQEVAA